MKRPAGFARGPLEFRRRSLAERSLGRGEAGDRHAERAARDVVQPDLVAQLDRVRVAALFAADAELDLRPRLAALLDGELHQPADAVRVHRLERVARDD